MVGSECPTASLTYSKATLMKNSELDISLLLFRQVGAASILGGGCPCAGFAMLLEMLLERLYTLKN